MATRQFLKIGEVRPENKNSSYNFLQVLEAANNNKYDISTLNLIDNVLKNKNKLSNHSAFKTVFLQNNIY